MITIDPNLRGCGVAIWRDSTLIRAEYVKNPDEKGRGYAAYVSLAVAVGNFLRDAVLFELRTPVIIEMPVVYPGMPDKDLNDLLDVVGVGAAVAHRLEGFGVTKDGYVPVQHVFPAQWKGNLKKEKMLIRIAGKLSLQEAASMQRTNKSDTEDILDGIGIGLWKLNRLNTKVYPGAEP
jgi:hypothetical protein